MSNIHARKIIFSFVLCSLVGIIVALASIARAEDTEEFLDLFDRASLESTVGRLPRPLSRTPENVTVVTAAEIEAISAHTLADILAIVPGVQIENQTGPASPAFPLIQGSNFSHVLVLLDGVPINNLGDNFPDVGLVPASIIERVEIVKGAASVAWGQALGGVINVITKKPATDQKLGGLLSQSYGERNTADSRGEVSGTLNSFGYYVAGGYFGSKGFHPNTDVHTGNVYSKFSYLFPSNGEILFTLYHNQAGRGDCDFQPWDIRFNDDSKRTILTASLQKKIFNGIELELSGHHSVNLFGNETLLLSSGALLQSIRLDERVSGGSARLLWSAGENKLSIGLDYDHVKLWSNDAIAKVDLLERRADRTGLYLNDTYSLGPLAVSAGFRYDNTGTSGKQYSPSFGATWQIGTETTIRGYTALGYSLPALTLDSDAEKVWTSQLGVESSSVPNVWFKGTLFQNETRNVFVRDPATGDMKFEKQIKRGVEAELRTVPLFYTSFSTGYTFVDARHSETDSVIKDIPKHTVHFGARYDDGYFIRSQLAGRYIDWNADPVRNGSYGGVILDLFTTVTPFRREATSPELFFSIHNLFDAKQYLDEVYKNSGRWVEGGVRFKF